MQTWEEIEKELKRRGQAEQLKNLASSAEGQKLGQMVDRQALARAAKSGDTETVRAMMSRLLATEEGRLLSEQIRRLLGEKGRG